MITIAIFEFLPVDENNMGRMNMLSAVDINIDENKTVDLYKDLILNGLLDFPKYIQKNEYNLKLINLSKLTLYSNNSLDEIKSIIETVVAKYIQ